MSFIQGGFFTIARASFCIFCAILRFCCSMINLLSGVLRGENKAIEINPRMKNMRFPEIHIYSILLLSIASNEKLKVFKRPVVDEIAAVPPEKLYGNLGNFFTNYNPLKKLLAGSCKVGLGIILGSSPFVDSFGKKVIINTKFPNKQQSPLLLRSSSSSSLIGQDLKIAPDQSPMGMLMKKTPLNPSSILFIAHHDSFQDQNSSPPITDDHYTTYYNNNNNNVVVSDHTRDHVLIENISCVFGVESMSSTTNNNGSKKLIAVCSKHRNAGFLSLEEIEKTDNYSCKITNYLPNPKVTTHMCNYCILEFPQIQSSNNGTIFNNQYPLLYPPRHRCWSSSSDNNRSTFLKNCETCNKLLEGRDIYIYRGESSFCSPECRYWKVKAERDLDKVQ